MMQFKKESARTLFLLNERRENNSPGITKKEPYSFLGIKALSYIQIIFAKEFPINIPNKQQSTLSRI